MLDKRTIKLLRYLCSPSPHWVSFSELLQNGIALSPPHLEWLKKAGYVSVISPHGELLFFVTPSGESALLDYSVGNRRYWVTTGIAIAALIKSFFPELTAAAALLWQLLTR